MGTTSFAIDRSGGARAIARWRAAAGDPVELAVLGLFVLLAMWVLVPDVYLAVAHDRFWTGTDGIYAEDQLQYLAWVQSAAHHVLVSDLFVLRPTPADYLQPMVAVSGGLVALGMAPWLALLIWKPVALAAVIFGARAFVHATVNGVGARRVVLAIALLGGWIGIYIDMWLPFWSWGYPFALVALGSALGSVVSYQHARADGRLPLLAAALAILAGWLHPWQGEVLILVLIAAEAVMWALGQRPRIGPWLLMVGAAGLPLAYYVALGRLDPSWRFAERAASGGYPLGTVIVWLLPLLVPAAVAYRLRPATFVDAAARVWPPVAIAAFALDEHFGSSPAHVFLGISVPLAVLIGQGARSIGWPKGVARVVLATVAAIALTVPVTLDQLTHTARLIFPGPRQANFMSNNEAQALDYVADQSGPGGVLTDFGVGVTVPAETGRPTYVGNPYWSEPDWHKRRQLAVRLLRGQMGPRQARAFVLGTGARFVILDCRAHGNVRRLLGPMIEWTHRFGCDRVYTLDLAAGRPAELAALGTYVRKSGARLRERSAPSIAARWQPAPV
jgi:hypothetical protein